ncbi:microfibril-associated glycoprotein 4-like [Diadema setosum]|uniref:microfibril-associated glycoprotein 4-like n=2 Tax=Diadema TaxID=31174 RepID=UPI003B3A02E7
MDLHGMRVILVAVVLTGLSRSYAQDVGVGLAHGTRASGVATSADVDVVNVEDVTHAAVVDGEAQSDHSVDSSERFVCRPHITVQVPPSRPIRRGCNCSDGASSAEAEKQTANLVRQLQELVQFCRAGDGGTQGGRQTGAGEPIGGSSDGSRQIYEALTDLTTVLKRFQTPGIPVPGSLISLPKDCSEVLSRGATTSGVYTIQTLDSGRPFQVYCDMETDGGGWTVFQKRKDGSVDFFRGYASYRRGFGDLNGEFWLGNDQIHRLTSQDEYHLRIDLEDFDLGTEFAEYRIFRVSDANEDYRLTIGSYYGTAGDALTTHSGQPFTTKDRDNDNWASKNCAKEYHGAWWYNSCFYASLNGEYLRGSSESYGTGIVWYQWRGYYYSLRRTEMKIRPAD